MVITLGEDEVHQLDGRKTVSCSRRSTPSLNGMMDVMEALRLLESYVRLGFMSGRSELPGLCESMGSKPPRQGFISPGQG
jgi:hypothetical protein